MTHVAPVETTRHRGPVSFTVRGGRTVVRCWAATIVLGAAMVGPMVVTIGDVSTHARLRSHLGVSWDRIWRGEPWRLMTSAFVQSHAGLVAGIMVLVLAVPVAEYRLGRRIACAAFFVSDWISTSVVMLGTRIAALVGSASASRILHRLDSGASAACFGCIGATIAAMPPGRPKTCSALMLGAVFGVAGIVSRSLADIQHPVAAVIGAMVGMWAVRSGAIDG